MRKIFIYILLVSLILIGVWCSGYFYGVSNHRDRIDETRADIQRVGENESRVIKQLDTNADRLESGSKKASAISSGLGEVIGRVNDSQERVNGSQDTLSTESGLIREGNDILKRIKARGTNIKD